MIPKEIRYILGVLIEIRSQNPDFNYLHLLPLLPVSMKVGENSGELGALVQAMHYVHLQSGNATKEPKVMDLGLATPIEPWDRHLAIAEANGFSASKTKSINTETYLSNIQRLVDSGVSPIVFFDEDAATKEPALLKGAHVVSALVVGYFHDKDDALQLLILRNGEYFEVSANLVAASAFQLPVEKNEKGFRGAIVQIEHPDFSTRLAPTVAQEQAYYEAVLAHIDANPHRYADKIRENVALMVKCLSEAQQTMAPKQPASAMPLKALKQVPKQVPKQMPKQPSLDSIPEEEKEDSGQSSSASDTNSTHSHESVESPTVKAMLIPKRQSSDSINGTIVVPSDDKPRKRTSSCVIC